MTMPTSLEELKKWLPDEAWCFGMGRNQPNPNEIYLDTGSVFSDHTAENTHNIYHFTNIPCYDLYFITTPCVCVTVYSDGREVWDAHLPFDSEARCRKGE